MRVKKTEIGQIDLSQGTSRERVVFHQQLHSAWGDRSQFSYGTGQEA